MFLGMGHWGLLSFLTRARATGKLDRWATRRVLSPTPLDRIRGVPLPGQLTLTYARAGAEAGRWGGRGPRR
jgi:hypothetical protein